MGQLKPWQLVLVIAALLVLGGSIAFQVFGGSKLHLPDQTLLADVRTGQLFTWKFDDRRAAMYPEKHPDTGEYTLLPVEQTENGEWRIIPRGMDDLASIDGEMPAIVDRSTGQITVTEGDVRRAN